jgi:succinylarginine dihydrolase
MKTFEVNFDGLVGPTHNYAGLSAGNVASMRHGGRVSRPREAALQGLAKMRSLADLGVPQAVLPPHERPSIPHLRGFGFAGTDAEVLAAAARQAPRLLVACSSASNMWVANAATVTPSRDAADGRVHFTPANLVSKLHRSLEPEQTARTLRAIFRDPRRFTVHEPVGGGALFGDEGAANHTRLAPAAGEAGLHVFVSGHRALPSGAREPGPRRFASRQARECGEAIARTHGLADRAVLHLRQHPVAINAGVFHNDVIAVGHENLLLAHEQAFASPRAALAAIRRGFRALHPGAELHLVTVPRRRVPLPDAVKSYLFNSQIVTLAPGRMALVAPQECRENARVRDFVGELVAGAATPLREVHHLDLRQSMRNGGGPACLRLRVVLTADEWDAIAPGVRFDAALHARLEAWVRRHYRERLTQRDLSDPQLLEECRRALDELTGILGLGSIYPFQRAGA